MKTPYQLREERLDELEAESRRYALEAESATDTNDEYEAKRNMYLAKAEMCRIMSSDDSTSHSAISAAELIANVESKPKVPRYSTGIAPLDRELNGGIEVGSLVQFGGQSGAGKTHMTLEILTGVATHSKAVFFNFEMGDTRIATKLSKLIQTDEQKRNLYIDNTSRQLDTLVSQILIHSRSGVKFFVIDSKMKIEVGGNEAEYQKISRITKTLSKISQQEEIIIFLINQISEEDLKNGRLAFKGSGDQQYDSDISLFYIKDDDDDTMRRLRCNKNRQDEHLFYIDLKLNAVGRTVGINDYTCVETTFEMSVI